MTIKFARHLAAAIALTAFAGVASAVPISYFGALYNLSIVDTGPAGGTYQVTYSVDFTGFTNNATKPYLNAVAWKLGGGDKDVVTATLTSYPGAGWTAFADSTVNNGTGAGCTDTGGNTWACAEDGTLPYVATTGLMSWVFDVTFAGTLTTLDTTGASLKMRFVDANNGFAGQLSCALVAEPAEPCTAPGGTPTLFSVPEPGTLALFGLALLGLGLSRRRALLLPIRR